MAGRGSDILGVLLVLWPGEALGSSGYRREGKIAEPDKTRPVSLSHTVTSIATLTTQLLLFL